MKFLQLCNTLAERDGGPARNAAELHATLRQETNDSCQLWSMALLDTGTIGSAGDKLTQNNMRVYSVRQYGVGRLLKNMRRAQVVVLHGYYLWWIPLAVLAARASRCVVLLTPHGSLTEYQERRSRLRKRFFRVFVSNWMDRLIAQFVVGSEPEAEMLRGSGRRKVSVAGVGTQLPPEDQLAEGAVSDPLELVSVSRIAPKKRIDTMIRSVCELTLRGSGVRLRVAGDGSQELRTELESLARELEVSDRVQFVGQLGDEAKAELFREADLFLLPSDDENFGIGLAEALAHGVPSVVTVAVGASAGMAPDSGRVIARSDPVLVASAVEELAKVADFQVLRASARRDAERLFGWGAVARRWIDIAARSRRLSRGVDE